MKCVALTMLKDVRSRKKTDWVSSKSASVCIKGARSLNRAFSTKEATEEADPKGTPSMQISSVGTN